MASRVTSAVLATSLIRRAYNEGGSAAVIAKGDSTAGSILLIMAEKGVISGVWEPVLDMSGSYQWVKNTAQVIENKQNFDDYINRRTQRDPDLWVIELDVPNAERFIADSQSGS